MTVFFLGPIFGLGGLALMLTILEGLAVSLAIAVLAERFVFPIRRD